MTTKEKVVRILRNKLSGDNFILNYSINSEPLGKGNVRRWKNSTHNPYLVSPNQPRKSTFSSYDWLK